MPNPRLPGKRPNENSISLPQLLKPLTTEKGAYRACAFDHFLLSPIAINIALRLQPSSSTFFSLKTCVYYNLQNEEVHFAAVFGETTGRTPGRGSRERIKRAKDRRTNTPTIERLIAGNCQRAILVLAKFRLRRNGALRQLWVGREKGDAPLFPIFSHGLARLRVHRVPIHVHHPHCGEALQMWQVRGNVRNEERSIVTSC